MDLTLVSFLDAVQGYTLALAVGAFVIVNGVAVVALLGSRDRSLVQKWTSPWLAANLLLVGAGAGVPLAAGICKSLVQAIAPALVVQEAPSAPPAN